MWRTSLQTGINQIRANGRMVWIYYLTSLVLAIPLMLPLWNSLRQFLGTSEMGALLAGRLDWDFVFEFLHAHPGLLSSLGWLIATVFVLHFFWSLFLSGGVFAVFAEGRGYSALTFWSGAAKYFGRFVRLAAWTVLPALAVLLVLFLPGLVKRVLFGRDPYENISYWTGWVVVGLGYIGLLWLKLVFDYARIYVVKSDEGNMRAALREGLRLVLRNFGRTFLLALLFFAAGVLLWLIYNPLANSLAAPNGLVVLLLFAVQQASLFGRKLLRLTLYACETQLDEAIRQAGRQASQTVNELGWEGAWA